MKSSRSQTLNSQRHRRPKKISESHAVIHPYVTMATEPPTDSVPLATSSTDEQLSEADSAAIAAAMAEDAAPAAKSLKCVDCGKLFKNADLANYHAEKSGHENFEESVEEVLSQHFRSLFRSNLLRKKRGKLNWKS